MTQRAEPVGHDDRDVVTRLRAVLPQQEAATARGEPRCQVGVGEWMDRPASRARYTAGAPGRRRLRRDRAQWTQWRTFRCSRRTVLLAQ